MPQVDFYHLTRSDMADALVMLVKKSQLAGKKVLVQCPRPAAEAMDAPREQAVPTELAPARPAARLAALPPRNPPGVRSPPLACLCSR